MTGLPYIEDYGTGYGPIGIVAAKMALKGSVVPYAFNNVANTNGAMPPPTIPASV